MRPGGNLAGVLGLSLLLALASSSCDSVAFTDHLEILVAEGQDPLAGASSLEVVLDYPDGTSITGQLSVVPGFQELSGVLPGTGVRIRLTGRDYNGAPVSLGRTGPIEIGAEGLDASVLLTEIDSLARIPAELIEARAYGSVIPLPDERFVVLAGVGEAGPASAIELVGGDSSTPLAGSQIGSLERIGHSALLFPLGTDTDNTPWAGQVAVIGGTPNASDDTWAGGVSAASDSVSLIDPVTGEVQLGAAYLEAGVLGAQALFSPEGLVAVVGGLDDDGEFRTSVEMLIPGESLPIGGPEIEGRVLHELTELSTAAGPRYVLSGGLGSSGTADSLQVWDGRQTSDFVAPLGSVLSVPRARHRATALADGRLLITGGANGLNDRTDHGYSIPSAELFDPESNEVRLLGDNMDVARQRHVAVAIPGDRALICAGVDSQNNPLGSCEVFDAASETFSSFGRGAMSPGGAGVNAHPLSDGRVLFVGGSGPEGPDNSIYLYTPPSWQDESP